MVTTILDLPDAAEVDVSDDDYLVIWDTGAGSNNSKRVLRSRFLKDVLRSGANATVLILNASQVNAPVGAIDALTVATSIALGATLSKVLKGNLSVTASTLSAGATEDKTATLTGAASGDVVLCSIDSLPAGLVFAPWVSAADTITFRITNNSGGSISGATYTVRTLAIRAS